MQSIGQMSEDRNREFLAKYREVHERFVKYCDGRSYGIMDTEDLVQECVMRTIEDYEKIRNRERLLSFMVGVANNVCNNQIRKHVKQRAYSDDEARSLLTRPQDADRLADISTLYECLHSLPDRQKEALIMFEITGFSMKEISVILESSEGAIKTLVSRGRDKLKEMMAVTSGTV